MDSTNSAGHPSLVPVKWRHLLKIFQENGWKVDRISGSHYVCVKSGCRPIPLAFHGERALTRRYAKLVLKQAKIIGDTSDILELRQEATELEALDDTCREAETTKQEPLDCEEGWIRPIPVPKCLTNVTEGENADLTEQKAIQTGINLKEELRRQELLETLQNSIATGEYTEAITSIDNEGIDLVGSSDDKYEFSSDLIFFKIVALTERAFENFSFNSTDQNVALLDTLILSNKYMEAFCERRQEVRALVLGLQDRVIVLCLDEARDAWKRYIRVLTQTDQIGLPDFLMKSLMQGEAQPLPTTSEFVYAQLDMMLRCMQFIVSIYGLVMAQSFRPLRAMAMMEELDMTLFIVPCIRRMLVLFDMEDFERASKAADMLLFVTKHFARGFEIHEFAFSAFVPPKGEITKQLVAAIAGHVKEITPVYQFAMDGLKWSRLAGVLVRSAETGNTSEAFKVSQQCKCSLVEVATFADMFIDAIEKRRDCLQELVLSNMTRTFMFDSFLDVITLIRLAVQKLISEKTLFGQHMIGFAKSNCQSIEEYKLTKPHIFAEFRKSKYNSLRRHIILLMNQLQKISNIYTIYHRNIDAEARAEVDGNPGYSLHRFEHTNIARYNLVCLFSLVFAETSPDAFLYKQIAVLHADLDISHRWHSDVPRQLRGHCESSEEVLGVGRLSFDSIFRTMVPVVLHRYVTKEETKRLLVIDGVGASVLKDKELHLSPLGLDDLKSFESVAFALVSVLLKSRQRKVVQESRVRMILEQLSEDSTKTGEFRRWVKSKAKRYFAKIKQLTRMVDDQSATLVSCMASREEAVKLLLNNLETAVLKRREIPSQVAERMNACEPGSKEAIHLATRYGDCIHGWSYNDANEISSAMLTLQDAGQVVTSLVHQATNQRFPVVKSLSDQLLNQNSVLPSVQDNDVLHAVNDIMCIIEILNLQVNQMDSSVQKTKTGSCSLR